MRLVCCNSCKSTKGRFAFLCQEVFGAVCSVCRKTSKWKRVKPEKLVMRYNGTDQRKG